MPRHAAWPPDAGYRGGGGGRADDDLLHLAPAIVIDAVGLVAARESHDVEDGVAARSAEAVPVLPEEVHRRAELRRPPATPLRRGAELRLRVVAAREHRQPGGDRGRRPRSGRAVPLVVVVIVPRRRRPRRHLPLGDRVGVRRGVQHMPEPIPGRRSRRVELPPPRRRHRPGRGRRRRLRPRVPRGVHHAVAARAGPVSHLPRIVLPDGGCPDRRRCDRRRRRPRGRRSRRRRPRWAGSGTGGEQRRRRGLGRRNQIHAAGQEDDREIWTGNLAEGGGVGMGYFREEMDRKGEGIFGGLIVILRS